MVFLLFTPSNMKAYRFTTNVLYQGENEDEAWQDFMSDLSNGCLELSEIFVTDETLDKYDQTEVFNQKGE